MLQLQWPPAAYLTYTNMLTSGPTASESISSSEKIISGTVVEVSSHLQMGVVVEDPVLHWAVVTVLHCGPVGAVLQATDGQTRLGDDVEESVLLRQVNQEWEGHMVVRVNWETSGAAKWLWSPQPTFTLQRGGLFFNNVHLKRAAIICLF